MRRNEKKQEGTSAKEFVNRSENLNFASLYNGPFKPECRMKKVLVEICVGTACYVMGASELMLIEDYLTPEQKECVEIKGTTCLDVCQHSEHGKAPFVRIDGQIYDQVNVRSLVDLIAKHIAMNE